MTDTNEAVEASTPEVPEINAGLYEVVQEAAANRDAAKAANKADYDVALERLREVGEELAERRKELHRDERAARVARSSIDRAYVTRDRKADRDYKVAVFGDEADSISNYEAGLDR